MKFLEVFLSVMAIIAIVAAAAFVMIFLVDLFISIGSKNEGIFFKKKKDDNSEMKIVNHTAMPEKSGSRVPYYVENKPVDAFTEIDYEKATKEQEELEKMNNRLVAIKESNSLALEEESDMDEGEQLSLINNDSDENKIAAILEQYEDIIKADDDADIALDEIEDLKNFEYTAEEIKEAVDDSMDINNTDITEIEKLLKETTIDRKEKTELLEALDSNLTEKERNLQFVETVDDEIEKIKAEKEETERLLKEKNEEIEKLREQLAIEKANKEAKQVIVTAGTTVEELKTKLEVLNDRLKVNEKELKKVKREYIPLNNIRKTLNNDLQKLRRKDALFVKQTTLLYGVNNYVDIDDEKAKKLNEEQELLDGLRMSVRKCEEVLENNKERLPILEQAYNILIESNKQIKTDIEEVEEAIAQLKNK